MGRFYLALCICSCFYLGSNAQTAKFIGETPTYETPVGDAGTIRGHVLTTDGQPAADVNIAVKGHHKYAVTDAHGNFTIRNVKPGNYVLVVSMVGLQGQEKDVAVAANSNTNIELTLVENHHELSEITITTQTGLNSKAVSIGKIAIDPMDLPQGITIIGEKLMRDQQVQRLSDVIKNVNGVYLSTTRANTQESFSARGYAFSSSNLFKNGARVNSGAMPEMSSLESVEVLKGSAAILYGQVSPGGVVNMVTKQPKFTFGGEVAMRAGSYDLYKPSFDVYGPLSKNIAYRVNGTFESAKSYRDVVSSKRYYVNPSLLFKLNDKTELVLEADYLRHDFTPDFGIGSLDNTKIADLPRSRFLGTPWQYAKTRQTTATATLKHEFNPNWQINTSLSYQNYERDYFSTERIQAAANGDWVRPLGRTFTHENYYVGQVNLTGKFKTGGVEHTLLSGIDADHYLTTNDAFSIPAVAGLPAGSYDRINILDQSKFVQRSDIPVTNRIRQIELPVNRGGIYVQDLIKLSSKVNLLAGMRWSYVFSDRPDSTNLVTNVTTKGSSKYDNAFSPRVGLVYKPGKHTSVFASYSNAFNVNSGVDIDGQALDPSLIDQYEIGIKNELLKGKLSLNVTAYRIKNNNLAQTAPFLKDGVTPNANTGIRALVGETTSDGVEVDLAAHPVAGMDIRGGYSYNFMRYTKTPNAKGNFVEGERLVTTPAHTANTSVFYTLSGTRLKGLRLGASIFYTGKRFGGWNNTIDQAQNYNRLIPVDAFTTVDLTVGYNFSKVSVLAKVANVTNTYNYYLHENYSVNPIAPTQLIGTVSYRF
ncbi:TonB-dependent siderophore receptor [Segetibacter sp. 3557_3]|nr:TonB-dependent siderophore receptor [Segetibacter sp. 3557_3]